MSSAGENPLPESTRPQAVPLTLTVDSGHPVADGGGQGDLARRRPGAGRRAEPGEHLGEVDVGDLAAEVLEGLGGVGPVPVDVAGDGGVAGHLRHDARDLGQDRHEQPHQHQPTQGPDHPAGGPVGRPQAGAGRDQPADAGAGHGPEAGAGRRQDEEEAERHQQAGLGHAALVLVEEDGPEAGGGVDAERPARPTTPPGPGSPCGSRPRRHRRPTPGPGSRRGSGRHTGGGGHAQVLPQ